MELGASTWTHEDLRFHRLGKGSVWRRAGHAAVGVVWVRRDNGPGNTLAAGRIAGAFTAAQIARTWMPDRLSTFHSGMASFGTSLGVQAGVGIVREFWHRKR